MSLSESIFLKLLVSWVQSPWPRAACGRQGLFGWHTVSGYSPSLRGSQGRDTSSQLCHSCSQEQRENDLILVRLLAWFLDFFTLTTWEAQTLKWCQPHSKWISSPVKAIKMVPKRCVIGQLDAKNPSLSLSSWVMVGCGKLIFKAKPHRNTARL